MKTSGSREELREVVGGCPPLEEVRAGFRSSELNVAGTYCCLGVACEVLGIDFGRGQTYSSILRDRLGLRWEQRFS